MTVSTNSLPTVQAYVPKGSVGNGITEPFHILCSGEPYIVKFAQNPQGPRVLVNEYICYKLAKGLDLPIPDATLVEITEEFLTEYPELERHGVQPGLHFGSKKLKSAVPVTSPLVVKKAINTNVVPEILLFDHWIDNRDRGANSGNLLIELHSKHIHIIDHTHAFDIGSLWDEQQLRIRIGTDIFVFDMQEPVYANFVSSIKGNNPFNSIVSKLTNLSKTDVSNALMGLPEEWGCSIMEQNLLCDYLEDRRERIVEVLPKLQKQLPYWKGGNLVG